MHIFEYTTSHVTKETQQFVQLFKNRYPFPQIKNSPKSRQEKHYQTLSLKNSGYNKHSVRRQLNSFTYSHIGMVCLVKNLECSTIKDNGLRVGVLTNFTLLVLDF
jgi:hypothetical protein